MKQYNMYEQSGDLFPIIVETGVMNDFFPVHTHSYTELIIVLDGEGIHDSINGRHCLARGDVVTVPPPAAHQMEQMKELKVYVVKFDVNGLLSGDYELKNDPGFRSLFIRFPANSANQKTIPPLRLNQQQLNHVISLMEVMLSEYALRKPGYKSIIRTHLLALTAFLARCFLPERTVVSSRMEKIVSTVSYMEENLYRPIRVSELASQVFLSVRQYDRLFNNVYGISPSAYLSELRLNRACLLMTDPQLPLGEIWEKCGFTDNAFFYRCFKKRFGVTPRQYRDQLIATICD